ncbi:unnamed protein product [Echinostoma caproni]|uniref:Uncharacterized protein n=1 Tax=Echinostoma caproni TaxID=27848 RepID=A0A183B1K2_9TREM|nr:unnamed protein product [Echinostoma caproni]
MPVPTNGAQVKFTNREASAYLWIEYTARSSQTVHSAPCMAGFAIGLSLSLSLLVARWVTICQHVIVSFIVRECARALTHARRGLYLSDLTYTNVAFPRVGGKPSSTWISKINDIIDVIAHFQKSEYNFPVDGTLNAYLCAQRYIEELQKFLEEDNYKTSLILEPPPPPPPAPPPASGTDQFPRCVSPSSRDDQPRKASGLRGTLGGDNSLRGLPALAASFHGLTFRSSEGNAPGSHNGFATGTKAHQIVLSPTAKAASINSSFESDQTPPTKPHHKRQQSATLSNPSSASTMTLTPEKDMMKAGLVLSAVDKAPLLTESSDQVPTTPINRVSKRSGVVGASGGKQLFPEFDASGGPTELSSSSSSCNRDSGKALKQQLHTQSTVDILPPVPPRPTQSDDSASADSLNRFDEGEQGQTKGSDTAEFHPDSSTPKTPSSGISIRNQTGTGALTPGEETGQIACSTIPTLIDSTAVAACAAMASGALFGTASPLSGLVPSMDPHLALAGRNSDVNSSALATSTPPHFLSLDSHSSFIASPGLPASVPGEFTVHIVHQGVIQRRSMAQLRSGAHSGLAALLSPKLRKPSLGTNPDIYGSSSSLSTCSAAAGTSENSNYSAVRSSLIHSRPVGFSTWRRLWATLVLVGPGSAAFMIYFEPKCKRAMHRNQLALGRHRDGSIDPLSFLLTDPSRNKVYRFRPLCESPPSGQPAPTLARAGTGPLQWLRRSTHRMPGSASLRQPAEPTVSPNPFSFSTFGRPRGSSVPGMFTSPQFSPSTRRAATLKVNRTASKPDRNPEVLFPSEPLGPDLLVTDWMRAIQHALDRVEQFHRRQLAAFYTAHAVRKNTV